MDLQLLSKGFDFAKKRKKGVLLLALFGASSYGAYKVYNSLTLTTKRKRLLRVFFSLVELLSSSAETIELVSRDFKEFLTSSSDEIPNSFRQVSKITRSAEFSDSLTTISEALTVGILRGYSSEAQNQGEVRGDVSVADRVMDRVLSNAGTGFISVVVGSFARNMILGIRSSFESNDSSDGNRMRANLLVDGLDPSRMSRWVNVVCTDKSKELIANCIEVLVSTAVGVYLDKTLDINFYDEVFSGLTNPNHESKMRDILVSVCNGAVETLVKISHQVLTSNTNMNSNPSSTSSCQGANGSTRNDGEFEFGDGSRVNTRKTGGKMSDKVESGSWGSMVLSTMSVPSNRRFVLDVTGRVTFETIRSLSEFSLWKLSDGLRSSGNVVHDHVKDKVSRVVTYFGVKSYVLVTLYLALYLHIICGTPRALLPA